MVDGSFLGTRTIFGFTTGRGLKCADQEKGFLLRDTAMHEVLKPPYFFIAEPAHLDPFLHTVFKLGSAEH